MKVAILNFTNFNLPVAKISKISNLAKKILKKEKKEFQLLEICFVDLKTMRAIKNIYYPGYKKKKKKEIPEILSFQLENDIGQIFISPEVAFKLSKKFGIKKEDFIFQLVEHGIYHLLGYNDFEIEKILRIKNGR